MNEHILALLIIAATHYVGGIATFGSSFLAVPLLLLVYGPDQIVHIVVVMMGVGVLQAYLICWRTWRDTAPRVLFPMLIGAGVGLPVGIIGSGHLSPSAVLPAIGCLLVIAGVANLRSRPQTRAKPSTLLTTGVSVLAGVFHGAFASGGSVLVAYNQRVLSDKDAFRATLAALWVFANTAYLIIALCKGTFGRLEAGQSLVAGMIVLPVTWLADRHARKLNRELFHAGVCVLLVSSGAALLLREGVR